MKGFAITFAAARTWARLGPRAVYGQALLEAAGQNESIVAMSADLVKSSGLERMKSALPERVVNTGISEQHLVGMAAGLAREGFVVFASSFTPFITLRAGDQVRMNLGYMGANVKLVGLGGGLSMGHLGNSHYGLEDMAVMRSIPGLTVVSPADGAEIYKTVFAAAGNPGPMYIRLTGGPGAKPVYTEDYDFQIGRAVCLRQGTDAVLIACGSMVGPALEAAGLMEAEGLSAGVINMHTIKPLDEEAIIQAAGAKLIVTVEEHSVIGGLGGAAAELLSGLKSPPPLLRLGLPDCFGKSGDYIYLMKKYGLTGEAIAGAVKRKINAF